MIVVARYAIAMGLWIVLGKLGEASGISSFPLVMLWGAFTFVIVFIAADVFEGIFK